MNELHSQSDNGLEKNGQTMFGRAVVLAAVAVAIILALGW